MVALEKLTEVFRVLLWDASKANGLSPIQVQFLVYLYYQAPERCRVAQLAYEFNLTAATVSDAVSALQKKGLVQKKRLPQDGRSFMLQLTAAGKGMGKELANYAKPLHRPVRKLPKKQQRSIYQSLLHVIGNLYEGGVITAPRMCYSCRFLSEAKAGYHCHLLDQGLAEKDLRIDCPEHQLKAVG
ncbi:MAG: MarR family transcriptional regulator [Bacteroidota bacterium]